MQLRPITVIAVLLLVVASLLVSGCTTSNTNQTSSATSSGTLSTATHDAFLEKYVTTQKNLTNSDKNYSVKAYEITWINSTSARVQTEFIFKEINHTIDETLVKFQTAEDATNYLNAMNKTAYNLTKTNYSSNKIYETATGHAPQIYKEYIWSEELVTHTILQLDNTIITMTTTLSAP